MDTPQRYPLFWPSGWPRAKKRETARFNTRSGGNAYPKQLNPSEAMDRLEVQLDALGATGAVLSTDLELNMRGVPRGGRREPSDPGAALYFTLKGKTIAMACDKWDRVADNIAALAKHIEALRGQDRWGVGTLDRAFTGYEALPAPEQWWNVLGCRRDADKETIEARFRLAAQLAHPDRGGSDAEMARLNAAMAQARAELAEREKGNRNG